MVIVIRLLKIMKCSKTYTIHFFQRTMDPIHALSFIRTPLKMKMDESGLTNKNLLNMCLVYVCTAATPPTARFFISSLLLKNVNLVLTYFFREIATF